MNSPTWPEQDWQTVLSVCKTLGIVIPDPDGVEGQLLRFYQDLMAANRTMNLTRVTEPGDFLRRHVLDSWTLLPHIPQGVRVADVGSGAGFPAIPLALVRPDTRVTVVESVQKKARFIQEAVDNLGLSGRVTVLSERVETVAREPEHRDAYDLVTARAVAALPVLLELCLPLVKPGGCLLAMKGRKLQAELADAEKAMKVLKGGVVEICTWETVPELLEAALLVVEKKAATPADYPRTPGTPGKKPLV